MLSYYEYLDNEHFKKVNVDTQDELYKLAESLVIHIRNEWTLEQSINNLYSKFLYLKNDSII
jgi:hypothetical protein